MNASTYPVASGLDRLCRAAARPDRRFVRRGARPGALPRPSRPPDYRIVAGRRSRSAVDGSTIQAAASAIWLELDEDDGRRARPTARPGRAEGGAGRFPAIVAAPASLIDPIAARIRHPAIELLIDGTPADRAAALALVTAPASDERRASR